MQIPYITMKTKIDQALDFIQPQCALENTFISDGGFIMIHHQQLKF